MRPIEELIKMREAQKRQSWIDNIKRVKGYSQKEAEEAYARIMQRTSSPKE